MAGNCGAFGGVLSLSASITMPSLHNVAATSLSFYTNNFLSVDRRTFVLKCSLAGTMVTSAIHSTAGFVTYPQSVASCALMTRPPVRAGQIAAVSI